MKKINLKRSLFLVAFFFAIVVAGFTVTKKSLAGTVSVDVRQTITANGETVTNNYSKEISSEGSSDVSLLLELFTTNNTIDLKIDDIGDKELLEPEPSKIPKLEEDKALTRRLFGRMLLDVEGNGEVYYIDPISGGKEYLANGEAAQLLLRRRALGINEDDFSKLFLGEDKDASSVCTKSDLGQRLKGRIVLRTEKNGEAYYIFPSNCRAYYTGTHQASYELMRLFSLGVSKNDLAKIPDNERQKLKSALRLTVFAHAKENRMTVLQAREDLRDDIESLRTEYLKNRTKE